MEDPTYLTHLAGTEFAAPAKSDPSWEESYRAEYERQGRKKRATTKRCRDRERRRRRQKVAAGHKPTPEQEMHAELARSRAASRDRLIELRQTEGFVWRGGRVAEGTDYFRPPFTYVGLVSDEHPILQLFVTKTQRARRLFSTSSKREARATDSELLALDRPQGEPNKAPPPEVTGAA